LRISPSNVPLTDDGWLGKGIYFADQAWHSLSYAKPSGDTYLLFLCEVAMGNMNIKTKYDHAINLPPNMDSTKGVGTSEPQEYLEIGDAKLLYGKNKPTGYNKVIILIYYFLERIGSQ
jgi:hypothetical protein